MWRALLFGTLVAIGSSAVSAQQASVLHITAALIDPAGVVTPAARHALLISDEPPTTEPRRVFTQADGTATVRLQPGRYTVESDQPLVLSGNAYTWTQHVTIVAGRDADLLLTAANAERELATPEQNAAAVRPPEADRLLLGRPSSDSVITIWSPTAQGSGVLIASTGLVATNRRVVGSATTVEVQLSPEVKVAARLLAADAMSDVAILWIDPTAVAAMKPLALPCADRAKTPPEFDLPIDAVCDLLATAEPEMKGAMAPAGTHLPVEPLRPFPEPILKELGQSRAGSLDPYLMSTSDFDVAFMTPLQIYAAQQQANQQRERLLPAARPLFEFGNWSEYVADRPPVLLIRVTPKMVERFWTTVGRVAARTQGMDLPAFKHVKTGFARMRLLCGDAEVTPIHPFTIEQRISQTETTDEGLYVFDPGAVGPHCETVKLVLYSEKEPAKADTRIVDSRIVRQIWQDFARYRE